MTYAALLFTTALIAPGVAFAQGQPAPAPAPEATTTPPADADAPADEAQSTDATPPEGDQQDVEVSAPGADIVVTGTRGPNQIIRQTPQVVSVLSGADIARTGEGDIAGALQRVTGLSVVGNGFVFVRGLGDRYSLALMNGSPLPSPEPLRRVVPLDIFPTGVIASSLVQKSYSVNYPGEFGGGVINLTTPAVPREAFLDVGASVSGDTETTSHIGYSYFGSDTDWTGFDDGTRDFPGAILTAVAAGNFNSATTDAQRRDFAASLINAPTTLLQRMTDTPFNGSGELSGGASTEIRGGRIGFIAAAGYNNSWHSRDALQQTSIDPGVAGTPQSSFQTVSTDNRIIVNGLLGLGAELGDHRLRWTSLYVRDTLKQGRLAAGFNRSVQDQNPALPPSVMEQNTYWFERQLITTQLVGEFRWGNFSLNLRGAYANSQRESPYERDISYVYLGDGNPNTHGVGDVDDYVNNLASGGQFATIAFSDLSEDVWSGALDLAYRFEGSVPITVSAGYNYTRTERTASRYQFQYFSPDGALPVAVAQERPDFLLSDFNITTFNIQLRDISGAEGTAAYTADLTVHGVYAQLEAEITDTLRATIGVRYEDGKQNVQPVGLLAPTNINNNYWLPAATLTWQFVPDMQVRLHASKTLARPQFRELAPQIYQDFESDREFTGNPFLQDSTLFNAEVRYEWYFAPGQRFSAAGFYKKIDNPIEAAAFFAGGGQLRTGFANAPQAELYGAEFEVQAHLPLSGLGGTFFDSRRLLFIGNYTYTHSRISADDSMIIGPDLQPVAANLLFQDGAPLTGQSDHLVNLQIGIEDTESVSQATFLLTYASERVTNRGPIQGLLRQPDIIERPGLRLDFVLRQEVPIFGNRVEFKFEARNLTGQDYEEFQQSGSNRIDINSYTVGTSFSLGATIHF